MVELNKIPHINEISNHGAFAGAREKKTATFRERYHQQNKVVSSLEEAIRALEQDQLVLDTLGSHVAANYIEGKKKEWDEYRKQVTPFELKKYLPKL